MTLFLLPNFLSTEPPDQSLMPARLFEVVPKLSGLIVESPKGAALFLSGMKPYLKGKKIPWTVFREREIDFLLEPLLKGESWGFVSDAGLPCIADPGALLVSQARALHIKTEAICGPSSIFLALMLSGLSAQRFFFHGYMPKGGEKKIKTLEPNVVHIYIEAPFRNDAFFELLVKELPLKARLAVAKGLTSPEEMVAVKAIEAWRRERPPTLNDVPTLFLFMT